ncbi:MAG: nucleotidyltransferase domain-containing protein [Nanoarchaeota archaeon]|nr:nucleotidyltransferase domain-containing protein [Nanoarchaeota archaeon]
MGKEHTILEPFTRNPWEKLVFKQVMDMSGNKSYNYVHSRLKKFVKKGILLEEKAGNVILYSISRSVVALNTLGQVAEHKANTAKHLPHRNIQKIIDKLKTAYYTFLITGSYSKDKQTPKSDVDIIIICDDNQKPMSVMAEIKMECELSMPRFHPYVFRESEFFKMLINKEENYGKEAARHNLIITGAKQYYDLLLKAVNNGFRG